MGMKVKGTGELMLLLRQGGPRAVRRAREQIKREGERIASRARDLAPVDYKGQSRQDPPRRELERSIRAERFYEDNRRLAVLVNVGGVVDGVDVDVYAVQMHEGLAPYGSGAFEKGPASKAKGPDVGGKFLERAFNERAPHMVADIVSEVRKALQ
jgi:hypothetical protein